MRKNYIQKLIKLTFLLTIFSPILANAQTITINSAEMTPQFINSNYDLIDITSTGSTPGIFILSAYTITTINNAGSLGLFNMNNAAIGTINNDAQIGSATLYGNSSFGTINNNSGASFGNIDLNQSSSVSGINNDLGANFGALGGTGIIFPIDTGMGIIYTYIRPSFGTINNDGTLAGISGNIVAFGDVNNTGTITNNVSLDNFSLMNNLNNSGTIGGDIIVTNGSSLGAITNNENGIMDDIEVSSGGSIGTITNIGTIDSILFDNSTVGTFNNSGLIFGNLTNNGSDSINIINSGLINGNLNLDQSSANNLTLNPGSQINGTIFFSNDLSNTITVGGGVQDSKVYNYDGDFTLNPYDEELLIVTRDSGNETLTVVSLATVEEVIPSSLKFSVDIGELISARLSKSRKNEVKESSTKVAFNEEKPNSDANSNLGIKSAQNKTYFWSEIFGSYNERSSYKASGDFESTNGGMLFGADKAIANDQRLGGFVGALSGKTDITGGIDNNVVRKIDSKGIFAGAYLSSNPKDYFVDLALIAGLIENDSNRLVNSNELAQSSYNNIFFTPSVTIGKKLNFMPAIASFTLRNTSQWVESAQETGSSADIKTKGRYINILSSRVQLESNTSTKQIAGGDFDFNVRGGLEANRLIGNQSIDLIISNQNISVTSNVRKYNIDGFVGFETSYALKEDTKIYADIEASKGISKSLSNNDLGLYGKVGLRWSF